jgi:hypothetical protein
MKSVADGCGSDLVIVYWFFSICFVFLSVLFVLCVPCEHLSIYRYLNRLFCFPFVLSIILKIDTS